MHRFLVILLFVLSLVATAAAADWPQFRGPHGDGTTSEPGPFPTEWGPEKNVQWKTPLPTAANGSPIVSNGRVFLTCASEDGRQRSLYCFDCEDGEQLWVRSVEFDKKMPTHKANPYAGTTPCADGERVVVWHGSAGLYCYNFVGDELWSQDLGEVRHQWGWGYGSSPILYKDRIIQHVGPGENNYLTAVDLESGKILWRQDEPRGGSEGPRTDNRYEGSWSTPIVTTINGQDQILCSLPTRLVAYDPNNGEILWTCDGLRGPRGDLAYSSPIIADNLCVVTSGFRGPSFAVKLGGEGNVTEEQQVWVQDQNPQSIGTGIFIEGYIYRPNAGPGTIECLDPETGEVLWEERAGGANHWASMVLADGKLYATNQDGATLVFRPNPKRFDLVAINELGESTNSTPAFSDGEIFLRTFDHLYCISTK